MKPVTLFGNEEAGYVVDPVEQEVDNPQRALQKFSFEAMAGGAGILIFAIVAPIFLSIIGIVSYFIDSIIKFDPFPGNLIAIGCFIVAPIVFIILVKKAIKVFSLAMVVPERRTAQGTVRTFFESIKAGLWKRSYKYTQGLDPKEIFALSEQGEEATKPPAGTER